MQQTKEGILLSTVNLWCADAQKPLFCVPSHQLDRQLLSPSPSCACGCAFKATAGGDFDQ